MKPEWWGLPLVQEKYQEEKVCDKRRQQHYNNNNNKGKPIQTRDTEVKRGVLQGNSLSPLLFCFSFIPLKQVECRI